MTLRNIDRYVRLRTDTRREQGVPGSSGGKRPNRDVCPRACRVRYSHGIPDPVGKRSPLAHNELQMGCVQFVPNSLLVSRLEAA